VFIQIVRGKVVNADEFAGVGQRWDTDVRPTAEGYLGGTVGTTADGQFFVSSRWESAEAAAANNDRPAQTEWFAALAPTVRDVEYHDCSNIVMMGGAENDQAGFVQVMVGTIKDRAKFDALNARVDEMEAAFRRWRSDVLGDVMAIRDDGVGFFDIIYFRSEAEARAAEQTEPPADVQQLMGEMDQAAEIVEFLDLSEPILS
jgi:hypothetical protein